MGNNVRDYIFQSSKVSMSETFVSDQINRKLNMFEIDI